MKKDAGISMPNEKVNLVHARLQKRLRALSITSFKDYCDLVEHKAGVEERKIMMNALTTNLTHFFREPHHFKHLIKTSLPPLIKKLEAGDRVRLWSAGCSTGEEAYSIAAVLHSLCPDIARYDIKILASDIDSNVLQTGRAGFYKKEITAKLPLAIKNKYFRQMENNPEYFEVSNELKDLISFKLLNLNAPTWPMKGKFDIIFCRNTVIYFDEETQGAVWTKFNRKMAPKAYLYIGHSERISGPEINNFSKA
ncbi:protein-glutamate O-methyltransferase, partial [Hellea sp.]|nr:protein-glutamate O-methyltransferase [Hellea sp.]